MNHTVNSLNPVKQGLLVLAIAAGLWALLIYPAMLVSSDALQGMTIAAILCTVPGILVSMLASFISRSDQQAILMVIGGSVVRMMFVLIGILVVRSIRPGLGFWDFTVWVIPFYLVLLSVETFLVYRQVSMGSCVANQNESGAQQEKAV